MAIAAIKGDRTLAQLAEQFDVHPNQITIWKAQLERWLELLSEIAPGLKRTAIMFNPDIGAASVFMPPLETASVFGCPRLYFFDLPERTNIRQILEF